ncbi:MAG: hypothetical protein H8E66_04400 [Planctomycetes bacterium]|nr:hypothetical protein [Planctomycetota bacterium]
MSERTSGVTSGDDLAAIRHFAGLAMQALIAHDGLTESESVREEYALWCSNPAILTEPK